MIEQTFLIAAFASSHQAIKAETLAVRQGIPARLVPLQPEISAGCGLALRTSLDQHGALQALFAEAGLQADFYRYQRTGTQRTAEKLED